MIVMAVSGCTGKKPAEQYVSEQLNCSLPAAEKTEVSDTHGGFPLEEELELLMYGGNRHYRTLNVMFCSAFLQFVVYCFK